MKRQPVPSSIAFVVLAVLFIAVMMLGNATLKHLRLDLTENQLYTLSESTLKILDRMEQPVNLYLFFSEKASKNLQAIRKYHQRVKEMLEEYEFRAEGKIRLHLVDPEPFSEEEDRAAGFGLQKVPLQDSGQSLYFGIAGTGVTGGAEIIPFLQASREVFLEYDIDKLIYTLLHPKKPVLGLMSSLPVYPTGEGSLTGNPEHPWVVVEQLEQLFEVKLVFTDTEHVDDDVDVLMVVHPKRLEEKTLYAIDQFVMRGGNAMFFVDPHADIEEIPLSSEAPPEAGLKSSSLNSLFRKWGFEVPENTIVADLDNGLMASVPGRPAERNILMLGYGKNNIDRDDVVTSSLDQINFAVTSHVELLDQETMKLIPLVWSSKRSMLMPLNRLRFIANPSFLKQGFEAGDEEYPIIARLQGPVTSNYDAAPSDEEEDEDNADGGDEAEESAEEKEESAPERPHIAESDAPVNLLVVADTDLLSDRMWVRIQQFFGQRIYQPIASNRDFTINAVDNLTGSDELIGIRSRASFSRQFTRVVELEREANLKYRETEENLQRKLREAEQKLQELQNQRNDSASTIITSEQKKEIARYRKEKIKTRKELREVKHRLAKDIDALGGYLKVVNIGVVPVTVTLLALVFAWIRHRRRASAS